jgi:hypothetical protein
MWQLYHDAMAIVRYCGKPDIFITMTANPKWEEITSALPPGQGPSGVDSKRSRFRLQLKQFKYCRNRTVELWLDSLDPLKELAKLYKAIK